MPRIPRKFWFTLHSFAGLKLSLFMGFILLTGTLATLAHEIDWALTPAMRVAPPGDTRASWGELAAGVRAARPDQHLLRLRAPIDPWFAVTATVAARDGTLRYVYLDPATATVRGDTGFFNVHRFLRNTHRHLMLPVKVGVPIVCSVALLLLLSLVSSLYIYKKWWRGFFAWPRRDGRRRDNRRRFWGDLHRLGGVWSLWFVALMVLTGLWYLVEELGGAAPSLPDLGDGTPRAERAHEPPYPIDAARVDRMIAAAQRASPDLRIEEVILPLAAGDALVVHGQADAVLVRPRANAVGVREDTLALTGVTRGEDLGVHQRISEMADPLHFGTFGGLATKLLWFLFGAVLTGLCFSGAYLYALRVRTAWREERSDVIATAAAPAR